MPHTLSTEMLSAWLRLSMTPGLGPISGQRLLSYFPSPLAVEQCPAQQLATLVPKTICEGLLLARGQAITQQVTQALQWALEPDQYILTPDQPLYPSLLRQTADAPMVLYAKGNLLRLQQPALAIVGARNATADGLDHAHDFACVLARRGWCIISGLAQGVDAAAHRGAIEAGSAHASTIAVLGTGANVIYPRNHAELTRRILSTDGLLMTEFSLGTPARPHHFPRRNRIVAGLSRGVLVVEAALKSGSLLTARLAVEMDREVFAIPGSIVSPLSRGPHALIQEGAKLVERAEDILNELNAFSVPAPSFTEYATNATSTNAAPTHTSPRVEPCSPVWDAIGYDPITEDTLQQRTNMLPALLQCELLTLELNGDIERRPNGRIVRARRRSS
jgi:DNA processing protein